MKTVLFIPGYKENIDSRNYSATIKSIESLGYKVEFISINWKRTTILDWVEEFNEKYHKYNPKDIIIAGFSFGAMTAIVSATERNPYALWLFSLSPYFAEDKIEPKWIKSIGMRRYKDFNKLKFSKIADCIHCSTIIFIGEDEAAMYPELDSRFNNATKLIKNAIGIRIPKVGHDVSDMRYISAITRNV